MSKIQDIMRSSFNCCPAVSSNYDLRDDFKFSYNPSGTGLHFLKIVPV